MNSRERGMLALNHKEADRVPIDFGGTWVSSICFQAYDSLRSKLGIEPHSYNYDALGGGAWGGAVIPHSDVYNLMNSDVMMVTIGDPDTWQLKIEYKEDYDTYVDEWGARLFHPKGGNYFDYREFPIKEGTMEALNAWKNWPNPRDPGRWRGLRQRCLEAKETSRVIAASSIFGGGIFEQPARIMPMEEFLMGIAENNKFVDAILDKIFNIYYEATVCMLEEIGDILDVWVYWDDLSGQGGPLVSQDWYKLHLMPLHRKLFDKVKSMTNAKIFFHCCGAARPWIPYMIEVGVDILNPVQISAEGMDPFKLKKDFGKDIVFWGGACNPQGSLAFGTPEEVVKEVRRNIEAFAPGGGFIFANVHNIQNMVPPENIIAMFNTCYKYGLY